MSVLTWYIFIYISMIVKKLTSILPGFSSEKRLVEYRKVADDILSA